MQEKPDLHVQDMVVDGESVQDDMEMDGFSQRDFQMEDLHVQEDRHIQSSDSILQPNVGNSTRGSTG